MASLMLVANPAASQFTGGDHRDIIALLSRRHTVEAVWPRSAADARDIAADAVTAGFDGVVAMGGDGVVHQVAQALVGTDVFMGVIPAGTTNVFARQIGLPSKPVRAAKHLAGDHKLSPHPVVTVEAIRPDMTSTTNHAIFAVGIGMDADVVAAAETEPYRKYRFGAIHYARTSLGLLWKDIRRRNPTITAVAADHELDAIAVMVQFHQAFTYFGARSLRFEPEPPDPMTALVVATLPVRRLPSLIRHIATGKSLANVTGIEVWAGLDRLKISAKSPALHELDGELLGPIVEATITHRPEALWVAVPPRRRG